MTLSKHYDRAFFKFVGDTAPYSAQRIVPIVLSLLSVNSVVDVGCGDGSWLAEFERHGVDDIQGLDGGYLPMDALKIPSGSFTRCDLSRPFTRDRQFDLAVNLETAEHLPESRGAGLVADIVTLSPHVLFSAAIPFQRGNHHINCQWADYWQGLFNEHGYLAFDVIRHLVWDDDSVAFWYRQNTILYVRRDHAEQNPTLNPLLAETEGRLKRLVHPRLCDAFDRYSFRELIALIPPILKKAIERKLRSHAA